MQDDYIKPCARIGHAWDHWSYQETIEFVEGWWNTYESGIENLRRWARDKWGIHDWDLHNSCLHGWLLDHVGVSYTRQPLDLFMMMTTWEATS